MSTAVIITATDDGHPVIRLDRPDGSVARLVLASAAELATLQSTLSTGHPAQPANPVVCQQTTHLAPTTTHYPTRTQELRRAASWLYRWLMGNPFDPVPPAPTKRATP